MKSFVDALAAALQGILGYLNFSEGRPDPRVQRQWNEVCARLARETQLPLATALATCLKLRLETLHAEQASAFRDIDQVGGVVNILFQHAIPAYRANHADLLYHLSEESFYQPFFVARLAEAVLTQRGPWEETERIVRGALRQVNDYVGHRPVAILENRPRGEPYVHERLRPIPLYLKGAGVAMGRYEPIVTRALDILKAADPALLADAYFDLDLLDELAIDPRGYDFAHPVDKRPNYCFGEWDPHHIDGKGNYRRFVLRQIALEGLLHGERGALAPRQATTEGLIRDGSEEEFLFDASAVLAGIILMASGISGSGPTALDSSASLGTLVPRVAKVRDGFYTNLLQQQTGARARRLQEEAKLTRQPFGGARQALNQFFARQRAAQIQQRRLALLLAEMGYPYAARRQIESKAKTDSPLSPLIPPSVRLLTEMHVRLTTGRLLADRGELEEAAKLLPEIDDLLQRGIACGALVDPWNILGFQGQYPRSPAVEDSVHDTRIEELIHVVDLLLQLHGRLLSEGAARPDRLPSGTHEVAESMRKLAEWWDRFGTLTVNDLPHVNGAEAVASAEHVAQALGRWRERGDADLAFWKEQLEGFRTPKAFALVIEALLAKEDFRASMALIMTWLGQAEQVPLSEGDHSLHVLTLRWLMGVYSWSGAGKEEKAPAAAIDLVARFFDHLEANAEDFWQVPRLNPLGLADEEDSLPVAELAEDDDEDSLFGAAYEGVTYKDSTDDDVEGEVLDVMPQKDFDLAQEEDRLDQRLQFLATLAQMWNIGARTLRHCRDEDRPRSQQCLRQWLGRARENFHQLLGLMDVLHEHDIPKPSGSFESMVEFDKRRTIKESLLNLTLTTCLNQALAVGSLRGVVDRDEPDSPEDAPAPSWEQMVRSMERALLRKDPDKVRELVGPFIEEFSKEPLLYVPLHQGGHPRPILRASLAQTILRGLTANLPRQGLLRETWLLLQAARDMEKNQVLAGPRVTEFDRLFQIGTQAVVEAVLDSAEALEPAPDLPRVVTAMENLLEPFLAVWIDHSKELRLSIIEAIDTDDEWDRLCNFVRRYGKDLFHNRFMAMGNLRGILHRGIGAFLDYLNENNDDSARLLLDDLDEACPRADAVRFLHVILHTVVENYDHYRDYNATTTQSDYGDNLYQFLDFLRLKGRYDRQAWQLKPLNLVHEVLARRLPAAAEQWRRQVEEATRADADELLTELAELEKRHGMRLITIRDRLQERFVQPLAIDGLCALIAPAMDQAKDLNDDRVIPLEEHLQPFTANPSGVGMDVPPWLGRLESEFQRLQTSRTALVNLAESLFQVPKVVPSFEQLEKLRNPHAAG